MSKPVLVTGGAGSLGRLVADKLLTAGHSVRVFDLPSLDYGGLEELNDVEIVRGDIMQAESVGKAAEGVCAVVHLAAILPPASEKARERTFAVNVEGTRCLAKALVKAGSKTPLIFSSSVSTYGDTTTEDPPVNVGHPQQALDIYAESKIAAEETLRRIYPQTTILRISGITISAFFEPPETWPFMVDQRIEFVHRDDVVTALGGAVDSQVARGRDILVAGGPTWRKTGREYVEDYYDLLGVPVGEAQFQDRPGWCDWYDTAPSQALLQYQNTSYQEHLDRLREELRRMMGG